MHAKAQKEKDLQKYEARLRKLKETQAAKRRAAQQERNKESPRTAARRTRMRATCEEAAAKCGAERRGRAVGDSAEVSDATERECAVTARRAERGRSSARQRWHAAVAIGVHLIVAVRPSGVVRAHDGRAVFGRARRRG